MSLLNNVSGNLYTGGTTTIAGSGNSGSGSGLGGIITSSQLSNLSSSQLSGGQGIKTDTNNSGGGLSSMFLGDGPPTPTQDLDINDLRKCKFVYIDSKLYVFIIGGDTLLFVVY